LLEPFTLHDYQEEAVDFILENKAVLLKGGTGAGKTLVGAESYLRSGAETCVVVAPINTLRGWQKALTRQSQGTVPFQQITSKKAGVEAYGRLMERVPGMYFIGWEMMRTMTWKTLPVDFVISDECHRHSGHKTANHKMLKTFRPEYKLDLSATPFGNKVEGAFAISEWLWPEHTGKSFWKWVTRYLKTEPDQYSYKKILGERVTGQIWDEMPGAWKMPNIYKGTPTIHEVNVDLSPTQRKHYNELEREAVTFLNDNPLITDLPAIKYMRLMELTMAVPSIKQDWIRVQDPETGEWEEEWGDVVYFEDSAKSSKADAVIEILTDLYAEKPFPVLVLTHSRKFTTFLTKRLQSKGFEARQFVGGMPDDERQWKLSEFGREFDVMVATIQSVGEGVDGWQNVCHHEIWCSVSDNRLLNFQAAGRLNRQGQEHTVQRYVIRANDSIEVEQRGRLIADQQILNEALQEELEVV
jgi:superfamily II DNA or RNA helicase